MKKTAQDIAHNYLSGNAPFLVNVDSVAVKKTESELNTPHLEMFNIPQQQVFLFDCVSLLILISMIIILSEYVSKLEMSLHNSIAELLPTSI